MNYFLSSSVCRFPSNNAIHAITKYIKIISKDYKIDVFVPERKFKI